MYFNAEKYGFYNTDGRFELNAKTDAIFCFHRLGLALAEKYSKVYACTSEYANTGLLYALAGGLSEGGCEVFLCEDTDNASFRFSVPVIEPDCGVYIDKNGAITFYDRFGIPSRELPPAQTGSIRGHAAKASNAAMHRISSFADIYISNLMRASGLKGKKPDCAVSCGKRCIKRLWETFFESSDGNTVLQVSNDGSKANIYSLSDGFISYEKLILAYIAMYCKNGQAVFLPDTFHYSADKLKNANIIRYSASGSIPEYAAKQRFLNDTLYLCTRLLRDMEAFKEAVSTLPDINSLSRCIPADRPFFPDHRIFSYDNGRAFITKRSDSMLKLVVQSASPETSAEICGDIINKLRYTDEL